MTYAYCKAHRSHFCPCVAPERYRGTVDAAKKKWDEAEAKYREKREARREVGR